MKERVPPQAVDAEQSVLGAMMISKDAISVVVNRLKPNYFYHNQHVLMYEAMVQLYKKNEPIDIVTLSAELKKMDTLDKAGGRANVVSIANAVPTAANVDHYAMFFKKVGLKAALNQIVPIQETSPNAMKAVEKILGFMTMVIAGGRRFSHVLYLGNFEAIKSVFGLKRLPEAGTTLTRYFSKIKNQCEAERLSEGIWEYLSKIIDWKRIKDDWLNFDSTVITRYGEQEGAQKGYNPSKKGRASHHPLLAFLNGSRMVLNIWNRSGNTSSKNNIIAFFEASYHRISDLIRIKGILADSGFYDESFIQSIEAKKLRYIITAKLYSTLQKSIYEHENWTLIEPGLWISEIIFKHLEWEEAHRYVIVRQSIK